VKKYPGILIALLVFTAAWQGISVLVNRSFLPGPIRTWESLLQLAADGRLLPHLEASLSRIVWALVITAIPASALGIAAGRSRRFNNLLSPVIYILHPLPKTAFLPVIMLFFGLGEASKIFLVGFIIFSQMLVTMRDCSKQVPDGLLDSVRSLGAGRGGLIWHVVIPSVLPGFFTGLRISLGTAVAVLFIAETFASRSGLGFLIMDAWTRIAYAQMYAGILALSLMGLLLFILLDLAEAIICPWRNFS